MTDVNITDAQRERDQALAFLYGGEIGSFGPTPVVRNAFPAYRVFVYGWELTADVVAITIQNHVGKQPNSCSISLLNERDKYMLTTEDILFLANVDPSIVTVSSRYVGGSLTDQAVMDRVRLAQELRRSALSNPGADYRLSNAMAIKSQIFWLKQSHAKILCDFVDANGILQQRSTPKTRYPFMDGASVFHANDPVRVFVRDPFEPAVWYHGFTGMLSDITDEVSKDNQQTLTLAAEDSSKPLRFARSTTNPGVNDANIINATDIANRSPYSSLNANKTIVQIIDDLIFGVLNETTGAQDENAPPLPGIDPDASEEQLMLAAIESGQVRELGRSVEGATLAEKLADLTDEERQAVTAYVARLRADAQAARDTQAAMFNIEYINRWGKRHIRRFGIDGVGAFKPNRGDIASLDQPLDPPPAGTDVEWLHKSRGAAETRCYLFSYGERDTTSAVTTRPVSLETWNRILSPRVRMADLSLLLDKDASETEFRDSLSANGTPINTIEDIITVIGEDPVNFPVDGGRVFMLTADGAGSIGTEVMGIEFNNSFAVKTGAMQNRLSLIYDALERMEWMFYCTPRGDLVIEIPLYDFDPDDFGTFERDLIVEREDMINSSSTFSDAMVRTQVDVTAALSAYAAANQQANPAQSTEPVRIQSLFPIYGTRSESITSRTQIQTAQSAYLYGQIFLNRVNADAHSVNLPIIVRPELGLNRPILWKRRNCLATTVSVVHNLTWNSPWRTTLNLSHTRGWSGQIAEVGADLQHRMIYNPIGGASSRPLNYRVLFGRNQVPVNPDPNEGTAAPTPNASTPASPTTTPVQASSSTEEDFAAIESSPENPTP